MVLAIEQSVSSAATKHSYHAAGKICVCGAQLIPPKNSIIIKYIINKIDEYSARKKQANPIDEYSTLYPETNSASASGKSKGCLLVSASAQIKKITNSVG